MHKVLYYTRYASSISVQPLIEQKILKHFRFVAQYISEPRVENFRGSIVVSLAAAAAAEREIYINAHRCSGKKQRAAALGKIIDAAMYIYRQSYGLHSVALDINNASGGVCAAATFEFFKSFPSLAKSVCV